MNDKREWALSAKALLESAADNDNVSWEQFLRSILLRYELSYDDFRSGRPFAALDRSIMAYMIAFLFSGDPEDVNSDQWTYYNDHVINRNVALIVGEARAEWPSKLLARFVNGVNGNDEEVDKLAIDFCEVIVEVINCITMYSVRHATTGGPDGQ